MAHGSPDWVRAIQVSVNIGDITIVPTTTQQRAAGGVGRYSGSATTDQTVKSWTVAALKVGELKEISLASTTLSHVHWTVTVGSVVWLSDQALDAILTIPFADLLLVAASVVKVEVHSDDGSSINASVSIVGKEMG
jgi:hypothetical protein